MVHFQKLLVHFQGLTLHIALPTELTLHLMDIWKRTSKNMKGIGVVGNVKLWEKKMNSVKQNLPVELSKFWGSSTTKATFKMYSSLGYVIHILAKSLHTWVVQYQTIQNHASKFVVKTSSQSNAFTKKLMTARWFTSTMLCESRIYGKQLLLLQTLMCLLIWFTFSHAGFLLI